MEALDKQLQDALAEAQMWRGRFNSELNNAAVLEKNNILLQNEVARLNAIIENLSKESEND